MKIRDLNWEMFLFFALTPIAAVIGTFWYVSHGQMAHQTWIFMGIMVMVCGISVTAGYHRLFSHRAFKASPGVKLFLAIFGAANMEGSILEWSTDHRNHHLYVDDLEKDPYSAKRGLWYSHMGWLFTLREDKRDYSNVEDLSSQPLLAWQHKWFVPLGLSMTFVFPTIVASFWGDPLGGFLIGGLLRMVINHHTTFFINSLAHYFGKNTYSDKSTAKDNWFLAFLTYGEGFHNFHHQFALDYRNGVRWFHYDPTKWVIFLLEKVGLATDLKRVSTKVILQHRIAATEKRLHRLNSYSPSHLEELLAPIRAQLKQALETFEVTFQEYQQNKAKQIAERVETSKQQFKLAEKELYSTLKAWNQLVGKMIRQAHNCEA